MEERRGPDRCNPDKELCPLHNHLENERKEYREMICSRLAEKADAQLNTQAHKEIREDAKAAATLAEETRKTSVQWRVLTVLLAVLFPILGWISLSHIGITSRLTRTETIIETVAVNQEKFMKAFNVEPEHKVIVKGLK